MRRIVDTALVLLTLLAASVSAQNWTECPFAAPVPTVCATLSVPRNWYDSSRGNITIFASKVLSTAPADSFLGTVWFLNGGTGVGGACGPGSALWSYYASMGFDVALPDFRGTGLSLPKLFCSDDPYGVNTPSLACAEEFNQSWGGPQGMYDWSITQGAHDLHHMISLLGGSGPQFVQGDSFGTFWGQRYGAIYPDQVTAFVIESFAAPGRWSYFEAPDNLDWAVRRTLQYCSEDPACGARAGGGADPYSLLQSFLARLERGVDPDVAQCAASIATAMNLTKTAAEIREIVSELLGALVGSGQRDTYGLVPAFVYRLLRCDQQDTAVIAHLYKTVFSGFSTRQSALPDFFPPTRNNTAAPTQPPIGPHACDISQPILYNLFLTEGAPLGEPLGLTKLTAHWNRLIGNAPAGMMAHTRRLYDAWPRYPLDKYYRQPIRTAVPMLFMNGDLDISCPWDNAVFAAQTMYNVSNARFVKMPMCPHVAFAQSPSYGTRVPCGVAIILSFMTSRGVTADTNCTSQIIPLDFIGVLPSTLAVREEMFGTANIWEYNGRATFPVS